MKTTCLFLVSTFVSAILVAPGTRAQTVPVIEPPGNLLHHRHLFKHDGSMPTVPASESRFTTSRHSEVALPLPGQSDSFTFVVLGDRTSGLDRNVSILADAVHDVNLIGPDFVMNVGDMVQGYCTTVPWMQQMNEYRSIMAALNCPWFPTVGNHDVYGGDKGKKYQNEDLFEKHFGPLWYAFEYRNCWFIVLFTDEGDRESGEKGFSDPKLQKMSEEQFKWLKETLSKAKNADHVFVFQHQPRWQNEKSYGDDWDRIHRLFVEAGNVAAVFAGHTHRMRYEKKDGIEYFTLSTTGGNLTPAGIDRVGFRHNYFLLNVRKDRYGVVSLPVSETTDPRELTQEIQSEILGLRSAAYAASPVVPVGVDGAVQAKTALSLTNTLSVPIDVEAEFASRDSRWETSSYPKKAVLKPGEQCSFEFALQRPDGTLDKAFREPLIKLRFTVRLDGMEIPFPELTATIPLDMEAAFQKRRVQKQAVLKLHESGDRLMLPGVALSGKEPFTVETWFRADSPDEKAVLFYKGGGRQDLILSLDNGQPAWTVPHGRTRTTLKAPATFQVKDNAWHHIAGVYDGKELRLYLDGKSVASTELKEKIPDNRDPVMLGNRPAPSGASSFGFTGDLDSFRLSKSARYEGSEFQPRRDFENDAETLLMLDMQETIGKRVASSRAGAFGLMEGDAEVILDSP